VLDYFHFALTRYEGSVSVAGIELFGPDDQLGKWQMAWMAFFRSRVQNRKAPS
jgi:hypothetical protein